MSNGGTESGGGTISRRSLFGLVAAVATVAALGVFLRWQRDAAAGRESKDKTYDTMSDYIQRANMARGRGK